MGLFDKIRKSLGGGEATVETVKGPSGTLRDAGIDPSGLDFDIRNDGSLAVSGRVANQELCDRICATLEGIPQVSSVVNNMQVGPPEPAAPPPAEPDAAPAEPGAAANPSEAAEETGPEDEGSGRTYTVQPGDSLWKIAAEMYGDGSKYTAIFEANRGLLDNPDKIFPGQELKIPDLQD